MSSGMYTSLSGITASLNQLDAMGNNLANASTVGYKQDVIAFSPFNQSMADAMKKSSGMVNMNDPRMKSNSYVMGVKNGVNFAQGNLEKTNNPMSLAIEGDGFFSFEGKDGETLYSRDGNIVINSDGLLASKHGHPLRAEGGGTIEVGIDSPFDVNAEGVVFAKGKQVGKIGIEKFQALAGLEKVSGNYFKTKVDGIQSEPATNFNVWQGYTEKSNVNAVTSMIELIKVQRTVEILQKSISTQNDMDKNAMRDVGSIR